MATTISELHAVGLAAVARASNALPRPTRCLATTCAGTRGRADVTSVLFLEVKRWQLWLESAMRCLGRQAAWQRPVQGQEAGQMSRG